VAMTIDAQVRCAFEEGTGALRAADSAVVPFRLPRNLQTFLTHFGVDGPYAQSIVSGAAAIVRRGLWFRSYLGLFFRDSLALWSEGLPSLIDHHNHTNSTTTTTTTTTTSFTEDGAAARRLLGAGQALSDSTYRALDAAVRPVVQENVLAVLGRADALHPQRILLAANGEARPMEEDAEGAGVGAAVPVEPLNAATTAAAATAAAGAGAPSRASLDDGVASTFAGSAITGATGAGGQRSSAASLAVRRATVEFPASLGPCADIVPDTTFDADPDERPHVPPAYRSRVFRLIEAATNEQSLASLPLSWQPWF
jgi:hypothetical protein